jgi:hypothetical protein
MDNVDKKTLLSDVENLRCGSLNGARRPHKIIFILSVMEVYNKSIFENRVPLSPSLENAFRCLWNRHIRTIPFLSALIEMPYYHLQGDKFWTLTIKPGKNDEFASYERITRKRIMDCVKYGSFNALWAAALCDDECRTLIKEKLLNVLGEHSMCTQNVSAITFDSPQNSNFVSYINSLHCIDANSDGALAEKQATNPLFHGIQVKHPWATKFAEALLQSADKTHIILTGHAGDGKSTIALELYKILTKNEELDSLPSGLPKRVDVLNGISIIKDLSEWTTEEQDQLFTEMATGTRQFVLVSNTGCLLSLFRRQAYAFGKSSVEMENDLLTALDASAGMTLCTNAGLWEINNLARLDNITAALELFRKLITSPLWDKCAECSLHAQCPVFRNVRLIRQYKERLIARLRLLLRRTVDYGNRLTMRQLSAHFAYMLTSGLDCEKIADRLQKKHGFPLEQFMFFNRFWGDDGWHKDVNATQLKSTRWIGEQRFGSVYAPSMERLMWLHSDKVSFDLGVPEVASMFKRLQSTAISASMPEHYQARTQIRRMVYFFFEDSKRQRETDLFLGAFLNSPMLCEYQGWLQDSGLFSRRRNVLKDQLFHVLQEQFSGIKLPEGALTEKTLYLTLNRRQRNIRQSSQIMLGKIDFNDSFDVRLVLDTSGKSELMLLGKGAFKGVAMPLALPFLDYISVRKSGGIGGVLQVAYVDRLENLKSELLKRCQDVEEDQLLLLKLDANNIIRRQRIILTEANLEVSNG